MRQTGIFSDKKRKIIWKSIVKYLMRYLSVLWKIIDSIWHLLIIGGIITGIIGNAAYEYITKGKIDFTNITNLPVFIFIDTHVVLTTIFILMLATFIITSFLAHKHLHNIQSRSSQNEYGSRQVNQLDPSNYKIFRYVKHAYILRNADAAVHNILKDISTQNHQNETLGICIFGKPAQGKTRLAWEAIQAELASRTLVRWPHFTQVPFDFAAQEGKQIILWLDDLHEYANPNEAVIINDLPRRFMETGADLIVVATCRDGEDQLQTMKYLENILERLTPITLEDISANDALHLTKMLIQEGLEVSSDEFDGTPGSLVFGLQRMASRYLNLTPSARLILKAMKLLLSARIHTYLEKRVQYVSYDIFELKAKEWRKACEELDRASFIRTTLLNNERLIEPVAEVYLDKVVIDYPTPHSRLTDDWMNLKECFQRHKDADGLTSLGLAAFHSPMSLRLPQETYQLSEECFSSALTIYLDEHNHIDWAGTQNNLGLIYEDQADTVTNNQAIQLLDRAIEAFNKALTVFSKENPSPWIMVQHNLGVTLDKKARLINPEEGLKLLDDSIQIFQDILAMETQEAAATSQVLSSLGITLCSKAELVEKDKQITFIDIAIQIFRTLETHMQNHIPSAWASAQTNLAVSLSRKAGLTEGSEEKLKLLEEAAKAHRTALTIYTKENTPLSWARAQSNLGSTLKDSAALVQNEKLDKFLEEAIKAYQASLTVLSKNNAPKLWSLTQHNLGITLHKQFQIHHEQQQKLQEALQAYYSSLEVYTKTDSPMDWAEVQSNIGLALNDKAKLLSNKEQCVPLYESIQAYRKALEIYTKEETLSGWCTVQLNLGIALHHLAPCKSNKDEQAQVLKEAIQAYNFALLINAAENPQPWALTQLNLSTAIVSLITFISEQEKQVLIVEGINAAKSALSVYSPKNKPLNYALAESNLGMLLFFSTADQDATIQIETLTEAINAFRRALKIYTKQDNEKDWAQTQYHLGQAITSLFELLQENITYEWAKGAFDALNSALEIFTLENDPAEWFGANMGLAYTYFVSSQFVDDENMQVNLLNEAQFILKRILNSSYANEVKDVFTAKLLQNVEEELTKRKSTK